jgi:hypothetical protein
MSEPNSEDFGKGNSVRLIHKIIAYVAIWIVALFLTAPGLWPLAWMFPLGLVAVVNRHAANAGGWECLLPATPFISSTAFSISAQRQQRERLFSTAFSWSC